MGDAAQLSISLTKPDQSAPWADDPAELHNWINTTLPVDPPPFDDAAFAQMRRDLAVAVQDLAAEGRKTGYICRLFGLKPGEVRAMLVKR